MVKSWMPRCWHSCSNSAWNSLPPSTWITLIGKGTRALWASRKPTAAVAVAQGHAD